MFHKLLCIAFFAIVTIVLSEETTTDNPTTNEFEPCDGGFCVPYYLCQNNSIITDGKFIIDVRFDGDQECKNFMDTCCKTNDENEEIMNNTNINNEAVEKIYSDLLSENNNEFSKCGHRQVDGVGSRITNNNDESQYGEFPWTVAVLRVTQDKHNSSINLYACGGALIHPRIVITAAHCVNRFQENLMVRAGEWNTQTNSELFPHVDRNVSEIIVHEQFFIDNLFNDIAILILSEEFNLAINIQTICLPPHNYNFDGSNCTASGWGKNIFGNKGRYQIVMKKVDLSIVPNEQCSNILKTTRLTQMYKLHESFICAGGEAGIDTCKGDGGSPLVCPIPGTDQRYYHAGIVSWGIGCGQQGIPGVYVNVASFKSWIDSKVQQRGFNTTYYTYS